MAIRIYLVPKIGDGQSPATAFRPAYVSDGGASNYTALEYGKEDWFIVAADVTAAQNAAITAHADATVLPANLDQPIGAALGTVQTKLEAANLPADWVTGAMSYRTMLKWVVRFLLLMQRFRGLRKRFNDDTRLFAGVTLDGTVGDLMVVTRQRLNAAATSFGLDTSSITLATTIRQAIRILGQQMTFDVIFIGETV